MPLPNPDYLTQERVYWNGTTRLSALLATTAGGGSPYDPGSQATLNWEGMDVFQRDRFHNLLMAYAEHNGQTEATALTAGFPCVGWQEVEFGGSVVGASASGLLAQIYTASVVIDGGVAIPLSVDGSTATTFTLVVAAINTAISGSGTAQITTGGNIEIVSLTTGVTSSVVITDVNLFSSLTGYVSMGAMYIGASTPRDILDVNELAGINIGAPIREQFNGLLNDIPNKPNFRSSSTNSTTVYNDNSDGIWKYAWSNLPA